jgi:myo-inositol-1(or 4)-monophosphatase
MDFQDYLPAARAAALAAGRMLYENMESERRVTYKGAVNIVTDFDNRAQAMILERISREFPDHDYLGEEDLSREIGFPLVD